VDLVILLVFLLVLGTGISMRSFSTYLLYVFTTIDQFITERIYRSQNRSMVGVVDRLLQVV
jgi:hypothetical protein